MAIAYENVFRDFICHLPPSQTLESLYIKEIQGGGRWVAGGR